ncbi:hypothetical protein PSN45_000748 [Yamadazyma tenuis]|uniref:Membrane magnesium transporter n=1 Tax=Candida tenuis (strain ATCC 10573 / BCRC 21748 / CBS 615 / JCM 9827 / NBRC 10315 / NRRL Y-1498 / VKM Y-70) TaxID=590646 RepID=G3BAD9_CANTC|nr:uncharacterized protein CANTEDRAFT_94920 [Yamadazyma tenuis ATCC 10573]EGV62039.1 hypothetical protein CANTEDRAFT_94920 [Yamadazyma tenuis ATCC 10573]WEJ93285.1 hypothetical protein PSN45_000748 [Yamadazyma tenuis]
MLGIALLLHCAYSAYEYNKLPISYNRSDLLLELVISLCLIFYSSVTNIQMPSRLNLDNEIVHSPSPYLNFIHINKSLKESNEFGIDDYSKFSNRLDFIDIVKMRREYNVYASSIEKST